MIYILELHFLPCITRSVPPPFVHRSHCDPVPIFVVRQISRAAWVPGLFSMPWAAFSLRRISMEAGASLNHWPFTNLSAFSPHCYFFVLLVFHWKRIYYLFNSGASRMFYTLVFADCTHGVKDQSEMQSLSAEMPYTSAAVFNRYKSSYKRIWMLYCTCC